MRCNYCRFQGLKKQVPEGMSLTVQLSVDDCGWDVFLHPADVEIPDHVWRRDEESLPEKKYWKTWLFSDYERRGCDC